MTTAKKSTDDTNRAMHELFASDDEPPAATTTAHVATTLVADDGEDNMADNEDGETTGESESQESDLQASPSLHQPDYIDPEEATAYLNHEDTTTQDLNLPEVIQDDATVNPAVDSTDQQTNTEEDTSQTQDEMAVEDTTTTPEDQTSADDTTTTPDVILETPDALQKALQQEDTTDQQTNTDEDTTTTPDANVYPNLEAEDVPEAVEVGGDTNLQEHDEFAVNHIKQAEVHFALRRTRPTLYRHRATCLSHARFFDGIDDAVKIAKSGVVWNIDGKDMEVIAVACLGYKEDDHAKRKKKYKSKSAKVADIRATHVIMRPFALVGRPLAMSQFRRVTAVQLFRQGTPHASVDLRQQSRTEEMTQSYVAETERRNRGHTWLTILPFFTPKPLTTVSMGVDNVGAATKKDNSMRQSKRRNRMRATITRLNKEEQAKQAELDAVKVKKKKTKLTKLGSDGTSTSVLMPRCTSYGKH